MTSAQMDGFAPIRRGAILLCSSLSTFVRGMIVKIYDIYLNKIRTDR